jgi:hypothetical protein
LITVYAHRLIAIIKAYGQNLQINKLKKFLTLFTMASRDDIKYQQLMGRYKQLRGELGEGALPYLEAAMKLREKGNVSDEVVKGSAYL